MVLGHSASALKPETYLIAAMPSVPSEAVPHNALEVMDRLPLNNLRIFPFDLVQSPPCSVSRELT